MSTAIEIVRTRQDEPKPQAKSGVSQQVLRQLAMLQMLPMHPRVIGTAAIRQRLLAIGLPATMRTIQRDLQSLQGALPIEQADNTKPYGWRWSRDADAHPLPVTIDGSPVHLVALVTPNVARRLGEVAATCEPDGRLRVSMTVSGGPTLRRWVLGFGEEIEVLEPTALREELTAVARAVAAQYDRE